LFHLILLNIQYVIIQNISFIFEKEMHCKCKADIRSPIIDQRILHVHVIDIICEMQCLTTAFRSFVIRKSFHHIFASGLVNVYLCILRLKTFTCKANKNNNPVSCFKGKKIRVGRSEKHFILLIFFYFIFIKFKNKVSLKHLLGSLTRLFCFLL
jgi:hypothetical protein